MKQCSVEGCDSKHYYAKGFCMLHWRRWKKHGDPLVVKTTKSQPDQCINCGSSKRMDKGAHGLCGTCYSRKRRHGDPNKITRPQNRGIKICTVDGCENKHDSFGYCRGHSIRFTKYGDPLVYSPDAPHLRKVDRTQPCMVDSCDEPIGNGSYGMCGRHYHIMRRRIDPDKHRARVNARRKRVKQATPPWADMAAIEKIYLNCPEFFEVDHVIPLKGQNISGLHVPDNLQYLPMSENRTKSNKF